MRAHPEQWQQFQTALKNQRIPQSMLFVGPLHCAIPDFVCELMQLLLCNNPSNEPCLTCLNCKMVAEQTHPDTQWVKPEKSGGAIKIDQIRELQNTAYLTPQRAKYRVIILEAADRMNSASANALLKILEEPAPHTLFILIAQQLSTVLPTTLSRCQITSFSGSDKALMSNLLALGDYYSADSDRAVLMNQAETLIADLIALIEGKQHPCLLASQWSSFDMSNLLWFFYLVFAQLQLSATTNTPIEGRAEPQLKKLASLVSPLMIFAQLDKISTLLKKISHNMNINQTLALEDMLFALAPV